MLNKRTIANIEKLKKYLEKQGYKKGNKYELNLSYKKEKNER